MDKALLDIFRVLVLGIFVFCFVGILSVVIYNSQYSLEAKLFVIATISIFGVSGFILTALRIVLMIDYRAKMLTELSNDIKKLLNEQP